MGMASFYFGNLSWMTLRQSSEMYPAFKTLKARLPVSPVDADALWRTTRPGKPANPSYQDNVIFDRCSFILARRVTDASERERKAVRELSERLPLKPVSLTADTAYNAVELREHLEELGIIAYVPVHPKQEYSMIYMGEFVHREGHLICSQGKRLTQVKVPNL